MKREDYSEEEKIISRWKRYCSEDLSKIENYLLAILDPSNYVVHHRLGVYTSREELQEHDLYLNRPAKELIFLTKSQHASLHGKLGGWHLAQKGRKRSPERNSKMLASRLANEANKNKMILCLTNDTLYFSAAQAAQALNIPTTGNVFKCCNGERKSTNGYEFKYYVDSDSYTHIYAHSVSLF